jgi:DNA-binding transcriptional regulator YiaG
MATTLTQARIRKWADGLPAGDADPRAAEVLDELRAAVSYAARRATDSLRAIDDHDRLLEEMGHELRQAVRARPFAEPMAPVARVIRESMGISASELGRRIGRHRSTVRAWEDGGRSRFTILDTWRVADALGVSRLALYRVAYELAA